MRKLLCLIALFSLTALPCAAMESATGNNICNNTESTARSSTARTSAGSGIVPASGAEEVIGLINLNYPGLERVKAAAEAGKWNNAAAALLDYYRTRPEVKFDGTGKGSFKARKSDFESADDAMKHTFRVLGGAKEFPNYGKNINWEYWPVKDIEIRVQLHRMPWWKSMGKAYRTSGDEKYAKEWVYQFRDWVKKNPYKPFVIDQHGTVSSGTIDIDSPNECFAWRPLEIGIRLLRFPSWHSLFIDSKHFTPDFLMEFLSMLNYNMEVLKGTYSPAGNHLIHQALGTLAAGIYFPEFKEAPQWRRTAFDIFNREISRQVMPDGCQIEFDPCYQFGVVESYSDALKMAFDNGYASEFPAECRELTRRAARYYLDYTFPDGTAPCFSDYRRDHKYQIGFAELFPEDKELQWFASDGKKGTIPSYTSVGYPATGFYTFRSGWGKDATVMAFKATERGMWHAQPDFGTFEIWAGGKVLLPDAGCYTYSGDEETELWRAHFKETRQHNALTLDDRNYDDPKPKVILWRPGSVAAGRMTVSDAVNVSGGATLSGSAAFEVDGDSPMVSVEHEAYAGLTRRRSIAFIDGKYFLVADQVNGPATGRLSLRFGMGASKPKVSDLSGGKTSNAVTIGTIFATTYREDDKVGFRMVTTAPSGSSIRTESDWFSTRYKVKTPRDLVVIDTPRDNSQGIQTYVTLICPFTNGRTPDIRISSVKSVAGQLSVSVRIDGKIRTVDFPAME